MSQSTQKWHNVITITSNLLSKAWIKLQVLSLIQRLDFKHPLPFKTPKHPLKHNSFSLSFSQLTTPSLPHSLLHVAPSLSNPHHFFFFNSLKLTNLTQNPKLPSSSPHFLSFPSISGAKSAPFLPSKWRAATKGGARSFSTWLDDSWRFGAWT